MSNLLQNRYGISALSKKYKRNAVANEIMIDKSTGEIQVKGSDNSIISYNYLSRLTAHIDTFTFNSYNADLYGKIYELEIGSLDLPCTVDKNINLLDSVMPIATTNFKALMFSIDIDAINPSTTLSKLDIGEVPIELELQYNVDSTISTMRITEPLYRLNRLKIYKKDLHVNASNPVLKSIKIVENDVFEGYERFILHSILLNLEE